MKIFDIYEIYLVLIAAICFFRLLRISLVIVISDSDFSVVTFVFGSSTAVISDCLIFIWSKMDFQ